MSYWFYYSTDGQKQGAITDEQLKELSANGKITPGTMLEHAKSGDKTIAGDVKWLTFGEAAPLQMHPQPSVEPSSYTASTIYQTIPQVDEKQKFSVKNVAKGCGCAAGIFF